MKIISLFAGDFICTERPDNTAAYGCCSVSEIYCKKIIHYKQKSQKKLWS